MKKWPSCACCMAYSPSNCMTSYSSTWRMYEHASQKVTMPAVIEMSGLRYAAQPRRGFGGGR
eukprot:4969587-Prymnesium_polylepis.1